ncbi:MAG: protein-L-isoaspartate(D-aspartate) O-methyltransferase [Gammaproteobacteria bacterium]|nr:protein-L-isoaspartate(D-aspartate) O-methyltransferase [Gammaproteobacteria bacterium]
MVQEIEAEAEYTSRLTGKGSFDARVMAVMNTVARHKFVPSDTESLAYLNQPLNIGFGQTISQPYIVALMTDLLALRKDDIVLEVGTGCGYQTAILSELAKQVYTVEVIGDLSEQARQRLSAMGRKNIEFRVADGYHGWSQHAPFDAIMVTAAADTIPKPLVDQLKPGGRMAIPVGTAYSGQTLTLVQKDKAGSITKKRVLPVAFVPLTGRH